MSTGSKGSEEGVGEGGKKPNILQLKALKERKIRKK